MIPRLALALAALLAGAAPSARAASEAPARPRLGAWHLDAETGRYLAPYGRGEAMLTLEPRLQHRLERTLEQAAVPWGATVLLDPRTGRVLAMAQHSRAEPGATGLALRAMSPAASIFKIVTAAALLEAGVEPGATVCYHGGRHRLAPRLLDDDPRRDRRCLDLAGAFGHSANVVFAKLAARSLTPEGLEATARRFLFDEAIPFAADAEVSRAEVPGDRFGLGATAAGFGDVRLSALHAALLGAVVANRGLLVPPWLVDDVVGEPLPLAAEPMRVVDESVAEAIGEMMELTVSRGTARKVFRRPPPSLRGVAVAGKTGSLFERAPFRDHSWFVGYAPADAPQVVVATVVVNGPRWRVRAPWVAREALAAWFADQVAAAPAATGGGLLAGAR
jgi:cell division protein FtsI/penicillin-binding protein 2